MPALSTSTIAALEEMLQNTARPAPADFMPIYFSRGTHEDQPIGYLSPDFIPHLHSLFEKQSVDLARMSHDRLSIMLGRSKGVVGNPKPLSKPYAPRRLYSWMA
jgi:hypothetical protein